MQLLSIKINKFIYIDNFQYQNPQNNIEYLVHQAQITNNIKDKLLFLNQACKKIEKFHSFFHFEQSFTHLKLAKLAYQKKDLNLFETQLEQAVFQDHNNYQALSLLKKQECNFIYKPPFNSYSEYLTFATEEAQIQNYSNHYWELEDVEQKLKIIKNYHLNYHEQAARLYLNRAKLYQSLNENSLAQNDIIKAKNLDNSLKTKDYFKENEEIKIILCLESNLGEKEALLKKTLDLLENRQIISNIKCSKILQNEAQKECNVPFSYMSLVGYTKLKLEHLLSAIKLVEKDIESKESTKWVLRIDIDILSYGSHILHKDQLNIADNE